MAGILYTNRAGPVSIERGCVSVETELSWCECLYQAKASELILYGRALGLSHSEAEDVLQETFVALMRCREAPALPEHYCFRTFRNRALNYRRGVLRGGWGAVGCRARGGGCCVWSV